MATIPAYVTMYPFYSTATATNVSITNSYLDNSTVTATATDWVDLTNKYLYQPITASTLHNLQNDIIQHTGTTAIDYSVDYTTGSITLNYVDVAGTSIEGLRKETKRRQLKNNLLIQVKSRADIIPKDIPENERIALETLREGVSEDNYFKYLKYGFVLVTGKSGSIYQVFRNKSHTKVWRGGKLIEEICVRIRQDQQVPLTDNVIAFKAMIEADEEEFRKLGNVYKMVA
jgi:hypothetical protein